VCLSASVCDMLCVAVRKYYIMWCGNFLSPFFVWFCEFELWQCIFVHLPFFIRHGVFLFLQSTFTCFATTYAKKLQSLTCVVSATVFFFAIAAHQRSRMFAITSSKDQTSHTKVFYQFLQSQSHCYKVCNHTETWFAINYILVLQTVVFFCNRSTSVVANTLQKDVCNHQYFWTRLQLSFNITVSWHGAFFYQFFAIVITLL
jgi:hypothetical protein